jgi:hypothetical protein
VPGPSCTRPWHHHPSSKCRSSHLSPSIVLIISLFISFFYAPPPRLSSYQAMPPLHLTMLHHFFVPWICCYQFFDQPRHPRMVSAPPHQCQWQSYHHRGSSAFLPFRISLKHGEDMHKGKIFHLAPLHI